jgi:RND superfamily putative drug exporter
MSSLLYAFGRLAYRRWGAVLLVWMFLLGLGTTGAATLSRGTNDAFSIPGTESQDAIDRLEQTFPQASGTSHRSSPSPTAAGSTSPPRARRSRGSPPG